jgi:Zn-dependent peptidase ImmA (M78 family)
MVLMTGHYDKADLDAVFGESSRGHTPEQRARTSKVVFVRSQLQLAFDSSEAKGRRLSAQEALRIFGWDVLRKVGLDETAPLARSIYEPARTLRNRRLELGLGTSAVARQAHVSENEIVDSEIPGKLSSIRILEKFAQILALDERRLGFQPNAGADDRLGVRLRQIGNQGDAHHFSEATVMHLTEAAWVVSRQHELQSLLGAEMPEAVPLPKYDDRYLYPVYDIGYQLARRTRAILKLDDEESISSVREIVERRFGIPLVQEKINRLFAGATIANGTSRGIVLNEEGSNRNVWVRRMTLCHELGHLLWDPDEKLDSVRVDAYEEVEQNERALKRDPTEIRANAFAIAFLAPPAAVARIARSSTSPAEAVVAVMKAYGISATAARYHLSNVTEDNLAADLHIPRIEPDQSWEVAENLTVDYFPIPETPISRRGMFAWYVAKLKSENLISLDTAATYLKAPAIDFDKRLQQILELQT